VLLSHYHWDHTADIGCLQYAARILTDLGERKKPLEIYGHAEDDNFSGLTYLEYSRGCAIEPRKALEFGTLRVKFSRNIHPDPCFSMRIEHAGRCMVYIADTAWTDDLIGIAHNADLLLCESSLYDEYRGRVPGHLTSGEAGEIATRAGVKHLVLTHLPHFGNHDRLLEQAGKKFAGKIELAATGKTWLL
jgi:ribonuclease BN (tRNA processing enzyme)